jgi:hypothetical protein
VRVQQLAPGPGLAQQRGLVQGLAQGLVRVQQRAQVQGLVLAQVQQRGLCHRYYYMLPIPTPV